jgi:hypothetical protein
MKLIIGQPGAFGDILICAPIAKYYAVRGHQVYWPIGTEHLSIVEQFPYVKAIPLPTIPLVTHPDQGEVLFSSRMMMSKNLADSMGATYMDLGDRPPTPLLNNETVEEKKYRIAKVPFEEKYNLSWIRNTKKEDELFKLVTNSPNYVFAHLDQSDGTASKLPQENNSDIVKCEPVNGYNILDWYKVIANAKNIYCIESSLHCFIDGLGDRITCEKFLLSTKGSKITTTSPTWNKKYI